MCCCFGSVCVGLVWVIAVLIMRLFAVFVCFCWGDDVFAVSLAISVLSYI